MKIKIITIEVSDKVKEIFVLAFIFSGISYLVFSTGAGLELKLSTVFLIYLLVSSWLSFALLSQQESTKHGKKIRMLKKTVRNIRKTKCNDCEFEVFDDGVEMCINCGEYKLFN